MKKADGIIRAVKAKQIQYIDRMHESNRITVGARDNHFEKWSWDNKCESLYDLNTCAVAREDVISDHSDIIIIKVKLDFLYRILTINFTVTTCF